MRPRMWSSVAVWLAKPLRARRIGVGDTELLQNLLQNRIRVANPLEWQIQLTHAGCGTDHVSIQEEIGLQLVFDSPVH
jgi:hypothetical protein